MGEQITTHLSRLIQKLDIEKPVRSFFIPIHERITHNQYIHLERSNRFAASSTKKKHHAALSYEIMLQKIEPLPIAEYHVHTVWYIYDKRTDMDNTAWAKKFVFDALVSVGLVQTDSMKCIVSLSDDYVLSKEEIQGVHIEIFQHPTPTSLLISHGRSRSTTTELRGSERSTPIRIRGAREGDINHEKSSEEPSVPETPKKILIA